MDTVLAPQGRQVLAAVREMGGSEQAQWNRALEAFDEGSGRMTQIALFPEGQAPEVPGEAVQVRLKEFELRSPAMGGVRIETRFMQDQAKPWHPNLLSATPTLEMGINIGDLSWPSLHIASR